MLPVFFSGLRAEMNTTINPRSVPSGEVRSARRTLGVTDLRALEDSLIRLGLPKEIELLGHHCHEPDLLPMAFGRADGLAAFQVPETECFVIRTRHRPPERCRLRWTKRCGRGAGNGPKALNCQAVRDFAVCAASGS